MFSHCIIIHMIYIIYLDIQLTSEVDISFSIGKTLLEEYAFRHLYLGWGEDCFRSI